MLIQVNFDLVREIEPKVGGGHSLREYGTCWSCFRMLIVLMGQFPAGRVSIATKMPQDFRPQRLGDKCVGGRGGRSGERGPSELAELARPRAAACIVEQ